MELRNSTGSEITLRVKDAEGVFLEIILDDGPTVTIDAVTSIVLSQPGTAVMEVTTNAARGDINIQGGPGIQTIEPDGKDTSHQRLLRHEAASSASSSGNHNGADLRQTPPSPNANPTA